MTAAGAPAPVYGCASMRQTARVITRTALAYSNLRHVRWWLAYLDLPLLWLFTSTPISRRPDHVVTLGVASAQLDQLPNGASQPATPRGRLVLAAGTLALLIALFVVPVATLHGPTAIALIGIAWFFVLVLLPLFTYAGPALLQNRRGRGRKQWMSTTAAQTGRTPILMCELAAWPATGGGLHGTGDGFDLVKALADDARRHGAILVGTARTEDLAAKYCTDTGAESSPVNPRLLRWP